jgi:hypothetical protein
METVGKDAEIRCPVIERHVYLGETESLDFWSAKKKDIDNAKKRDLENPQNRDIDNTQNIDIDNTQNIDNTNDKKDEAKPTEYALVYYSREPDYCRELIRGSMRNQRRKTVTWKLFQGNVHSPIFMELKDASKELVGYLFDDIYQSLKECFGKPRTDTEILDLRQRIRIQEEEAEDKFDAEMRLREIEESWESILYGLIIRSFVLLTQSILRKYIVLPSLIITKNIIRILLFQNPEWSEDFRDLKKEVHIKCTYQGVPVSQNELPKNWFNDGIQIRILSPFVLKPWHNSKSKVRSTEKKKDPLKKKKRSTEDRNFWFLTAYGTLTESYLDYHVPIPYLFSGPFFKKIKKQLKKDLKNHFFLVLKVFNERKKWFRTMLNEIENGNIESLLFGFKKIDKLSESKKISTISNNNPIIEESPVIIESFNWTNSSFTEKRIKDLNVKTKTIIKQIEKMTEEKKEGIITSEINLNSNKTTYDAKILELQKNILQLQRRNIRLIRKSYSFFKIFMERVYVDILLCIISNTRIHGQRFVDFLLDFLESRNKIVNKSSSKKKNEERIDKTNQSIIPFLSSIDKFTNMNSKNSCDVSSLSQAYVLFKLSQIQIRNGYKLRSIFESDGRSVFLTNEIKDYFLRIEGINSKLRDKNRPNSLMNQWTNWLKIHYQYNIPRSTWSRLLAQNWRNRINEHRVAQNKDLVEYDSTEKTQLILYTKEQVELLERKKKIKKQYRYDLFCYQHLNYVDKKKSSIYGSLFQANKNQAISYNYDTSKGELLDIIVGSSIQNYIPKGDSMEKNMNRKYFNLMVVNVERTMNSIPNPELLNSRFWFFSKLRILFDAYRKNPFYILPMYSLFSGNEGITNETESRTVELKTGKEEEELKTGKEEEELKKGIALEELKPSKEAIKKELKIRFKSSKYYRPGTNHSRMNRINKKYRTNVKRERDFLLQRYVGVYLNCGKSVQETLLNNVNILLLLLKMNKLKKFVIKSIKKVDLDMDYITYLNSRDFSYTECRDTVELRPNLVFFIEPINKLKPSATIIKRNNNNGSPCIHSKLFCGTSVHQY